MSLSYVFSSVFFIAFAIYLFLGIYTLSLDVKNSLNRVFFGVCLVLCVWAFGFSLASSALDYEKALLWHRLASLGWGTFYSIFLQFILILTERRIVKNKWLYVLLYFPTVVNAYAFGIGYLASEQYKLVNTEVGWINISLNTWEKCLFNIYYISFIIAAVCLLYQWGRRTKEKKKQAYILIASLVVSLLLGTMIDTVGIKYMLFIVPQMGPVVCLIPVTVIFYFIKRCGLMDPLTKSRIAEPGKILSEFNLASIYRIMSIMFFFGGVLIFASQYFFKQIYLPTLLFFSISFFIYGIIFQVILRMINTTVLRETIFIVIVALSIPLISLRFINSASITVWATPFAFVILFVVFNKRRMMFWLGISIIATQILVWIKVPTAIVQVDAADHIGRIGIFGITLWLALYVNRVYIQRLEENEAQINFQKMVSKMSADFVNVTKSNLDEKIDGMLRQIGEYFQVDRIYLFVFSKDLRICTCNHEWCNEGIESAVDSRRELSVCSFENMNQILSNDIVNISDVEMLPLGEEKELLKKHQVKSLLLFSLTSKGKVLGFFGLDSVKMIKIWRQDHQELLRILANLLADAFVKVEAEKEINHMAYYDALTGLANRTLLKERLEQAIYLASRTEKLIVVIFVDLDSFKSVNDTMGHEGGDELIKLVAKRLSGCVRKQDTVARFGGDEFFIMLTQISTTEDIHKIANDVMKVFDQPLKVNYQEFFFTASAGIAIYPVDGEDADTLIKNADLAMYTSKDNGKNQYTLCSSSMKEDVLKKMQLTNSLYRAQERNELLLYYQPQVNVLTKEIIGFEALLRWNHPDLGMISPGIFIPLAEQTGLINPIGRWVLQTACLQNKKWQDMGLPPMRMAVNLSVEQFRNPNLVSIVERTLNETGLEPLYLELEITESTAVRESAYIIEVLQKLKKLGVTIAIDDFGTEYSSLNRLKTLPVDRIKIDMQFVRGISEGNKDEAIAKIIVQLAKNLQLSVIAEGVETYKQFEFFKVQVCDEIQGYYFYKPMPAVELEALLIKQFK